MRVCKIEGYTNAAERSRLVRDFERGVYQVRQSGTALSGPLTCTSPAARKPIVPVSFCALQQCLALLAPPAMPPFTACRCS